MITLYGIGGNSNCDLVLVVLAVQVMCIDDNNVQSVCTYAIGIPVWLMNSIMTY